MLVHKQGNNMTVRQTARETSVTHRIHIDGGTAKWRNGGELAEQLMRCDVVIVEMSADEDG